MVVNIGTRIQGSSGPSSMSTDAQWIHEKKKGKKVVSDDARDEMTYPTLARAYAHGNKSAGNRRKSQSCPTIIHLFAISIQSWPPSNFANLRQGQGRMDAIMQLSIRVGHYPCS